MTERCIHCDEAFDAAEQGSTTFNCSYHARTAQSIGNAGPRYDYDELWRFPCCGLIVVASDRPANKPGCIQGFHVASSRLIFVSYAHADSKLGDFLANELTRRGYPLWIDSAEILPGADWKTSVSEAIAGCTHVVLLYSTMTQRPVVDWEIEEARRHKRTIIPILIEDCQLPDKLSHISHVDWRTHTRDFRNKDDTGYLGASFDLLDDALRDPYRMRFLDRIRQGGRTQS